MDFTSCDEEVHLELIKETRFFQPENHGYYLCELIEGKSCVIVIKKCLFLQ